MIKYSTSAMKALAFLFRPYNDIDIYIEDTACRNMWELLINRMLNGKAKITRIFQLGGRDAVIRECQNYITLPNTSKKRKAAFLIDGDFDILLKRKAIKLPFLYRLNVYCVENILFCNKAIIELAYDSIAKKSRIEVAIMVNWKVYVNDVEAKLRPLFLTYGIAYLLDNSIETTGYHISHLYDHSSNPFFLSKTKINLKIAEINTTLMKRFDKVTIDNVEKKVTKRAPKSTKGFLRAISGKTYLLPYLHLYLQKTVHYKGTLEQFSVILARYCKIDQDKKFNQFILLAAKK